MVLLIHKYCTYKAPNKQQNPQIFMPQIKTYMYIKIIVFMVQCSIIKSIHYYVLSCYFFACTTFVLLATISGNFPGCVDLLGFIRNIFKFHCLNAVMIMMIIFYISVLLLLLVVIIV